MQQTTDGGYILGGRSGSDISGDKTQPVYSLGYYDYWIVKINALGDKQWDKTFGGTESDALYSLQQTTDGGYILGGSSDSGISGDKSQPNWDSTLQSLDFWIIKIDSVGNKLWDKRFGGKEADKLQSLKQTADGGYILVGWSVSGISGDKTEPSWGEWDFWIVKIDAFGNKQWDKDLGGADYENDFGSISQTYDGGYLIAGTSYSPISGDKSEDNLGEKQTWIVRTDAIGNRLWDKTIFTTGKDEVGFAIQIENGCYAIANYSNADTGGYKTQLSQGEYDYWIVKFCDTTIICSSLNVTTDSITAHVTCLGASDGAAKAAASGGTPPYSFLWSYGQTDDSPTDLSAGTHSVTVTDANGCVATTSITIAEGPEPCVGIYDVSLNSIFLLPNPANGLAMLRAPNIQGKVSFQLYNPMGEQVIKQTIDGSQLQQGVQLDLSEFPGNVFFLNLRTEKENKVIKVMKL